MPDALPHPATDDPPADPRAGARAAPLRYVSDCQPGFRREHVGDGLRYVDADGAEITDVGTLDRIRRLAIPLAYEGLWICRRSGWATRRRSAASVTSIRRLKEAAPARGA